LCALLELGTALHPYRDSIVLVGGWVPYFLLDDHRGPDRDFRHVGSIDIDLAVDPGTVDSQGYAEIVELIMERGYRQRKSENGDTIPFSHSKKVKSPADAKEYSIQVDFLTQADPNAGKKHRHRKVQPGLQARIALGCEIAFGHNYRRKLSGILPGNGETTLELRLLDIAGCIGMKGIALGERYREKDAYDIFSVVGKCLDGPVSVANKVKPYSNEAGIKRGLDNIREKFRSQRAEGPSWVAAFLSDDPEERKRINAEAYIAVTDFIKALDE